MRTGRILLAAGTAIAVFAVGGVAWAYWTSAGAGSGSAAVTAAAPGLTLHARTDGELLPGTSVPVVLTADNASATGLRLGSVHLVGVSADAGHAGCAVADFSMADVAVDQVVPPHTKAFALAGAAALAYANTSVDQSACKGATLTLTISSD